VKEGMGKRGAPVSLLSNNRKSKPPTTSKKKGEIACRGEHIQE